MNTARGGQPSSPLSRLYATAKDTLSINGPMLIVRQSQLHIIEAFKRIKPAPQRMNAQSVDL